MTLATGEQMVYSGHENERHAHTDGVAFVMMESVAKAFLVPGSVSPRIIT